MKGLGAASLKWTWSPAVAEFIAPTLYYELGDQIAEWYICLYIRDQQINFVIRLFISGFALWIIDIFCNNFNLFNTVVHKLLKVAVGR